MGFTIHYPYLPNPWPKSSHLPQPRLMPQSCCRSWMLTPMPRSFTGRARARVEAIEAGGAKITRTVFWLSDLPIGSLCMLYMVTWIPSIYPQCQHIYQHHGSYGLCKHPKIVKTCENLVETRTKTDVMGISIGISWRFYGENKPSGYLKFTWQVRFGHPRTQTEAFSRGFFHFQPWLSDGIWIYLNIECLFSPMDQLIIFPHGFFPIMNDDRWLKLWLILIGLV